MKRLLDRIRLLERKVSRFMENPFAVSAYFLLSIAICIAVAAAYATWRI